MSQHPIYQTELLTSPEFIEYKNQLEKKMEEEHFRRMEQEANIGKTDLTPDLRQYLTRIYEMLAGPFGSFIARVGDGSRSGSSIVEEANHAAAVLAGGAGSKQQQQGMTQTQKIYGPDCPVDNIAESFMEKAQRRAELAPLRPLLARPKDVNEWPAETPPWAKIVIHMDHESVESVVTEYLHGLNGSPSLKDLEAKYGPKSRPKNSWRAGGKGVKNKEWCLRQGLYGFLDEHPGEEVRAFTDYVQQHFSLELQNQGVTLSKPGKNILGKAKRKLQVERSGFEERQQKIMANQAEQRKRKLEEEQSQQQLLQQQKKDRQPTGIIGMEVG
jgi:hypothetical protein